MTSQCFGQTNFPEDWLGNYKGEMVLSSLLTSDSTSQITSQKVNVEFIFQEEIPDSLWSYKMIYRSEKFGDIVKDYAIKVVKEDNEYDFIFDENNGILMEMSLLNNVLFGVYEVMGDLYFTSLRQDEKGLFFELIAAPMHDPLISGTPNTDEEDGISANSYKPTICQSVHLILQ